MAGSLRIQLTFWYSLVLAVALVISAVLFYVLIERATRQIADDSLEDASDSLISRLRSTDSSDDSIQEILSDFRFQYTVFAIFDRKKTVIAASPRLQKDTQLKFPTFNISASEIPAEVLNKVITLPRSHETFLLQNKTRVRVYGEKARLNGREIYIVTLRPLTNQIELLSDIRIIAAFVIPLVLIFASLAGYYLARKGLNPVSEIGNQALQITSQSLNTRLLEKGRAEELATLARSFNQMLGKLEKSFEIRRRFMSDASHELRTPLVIVRGEAEVALQKESRSESEYRESLEIIRQESVRLSNIVDDLFILARADSEQYNLNRTTFYLDALAIECARAVRTLIQEKQVRFSLEHDEGLMFVGDEPLVRRLLIILLDNAIKYSDKGGEVSLKVRSDELNYRVQISNTGRQIPAEERDRIFDRFYRGERGPSYKGDSPLGSGAGLGLSIGAWIAEAHGGRLELAGSGNTGTIFIATLPKSSD